MWRLRTNIWPKSGEGDHTLSPNSFWKSITITAVLLFWWMWGEGEKHIISKFYLVLVRTWDQLQLQWILLLKTCPGTAICSAEPARDVASSKGWVIWFVTIYLFIHWNERPIGLPTSYVLHQEVHHWRMKVLCHPVHLHRRSYINLSDCKYSMPNLKLKCKYSPP